MVGLLAGLFVWTYDYDFFLNAGGPATPISGIILQFAHLEDAGGAVIALAPMVILMTLGAAAGFGVSRLLSRKH